MFVSKSLTTGVSRCRQISRIAGRSVNHVYSLYPDFTTSGITFYCAFVIFLFYMYLWTRMLYKMMSLFFESGI